MSASPAQSGIVVRKAVQRGSSAATQAAEERMREHRDVKERADLVCVGHVDAGKSTLMAQLLVATGAVEKRQVRKNERESAAAGKASFALAWVLDSSAEERERGVTMDVAVSRFETEHRTVRLLDAPGHRDFIPKMISGAAQADVAVLVVSAYKGEFEAGLEGQTREHALLVRALGVSHLIVAVNKLDACAWDKDRYDFVASTTREFLTKTAGFKGKNVRFVPVSGLTGGNVLRAPAELAAWYEGGTLIDAIDTLPGVPRALELPTRVVVNDVFRGGSNTVTVVAKVESGSVLTGDQLLALPGNVLATVKSLDGMQWARAGDALDITLVDVEPALITVGTFLCAPESPIPLVTRLRAQIVTFAVEDKPLLAGQQVLLHYQGLEIPCTVSRLVSQLDKATGAVHRKKPRALGPNTSAIVEFTLEDGRAVPIELYSDFRSLGRVLVRDEGRTLAAGITLKLLAEATPAAIAAGEAARADL